MLKISEYRKRRIRAWKNAFREYSYIDIWKKDPSTCPFCKSNRILPTNNSGPGDYYECLTTVCGSRVTAGASCLIRLHEQFIKSRSE